MPAPTVDIIVPVWNNPFETRACLAAILTHSPDARLIVVEHGSNRETQIMLEEFSEPLGDKALFLASERNLGLVPAINLGLKHSDSDYAVIVRPHVTVTRGWLAALVSAAAQPETGIVSPVFSGSSAPVLRLPPAGCRQAETFTISFSALLLKKEMGLWPEGFDEEMDGGEWCLKDFVRRAGAKGFHTAVACASQVICAQETVFGSEKRRQEQYLASREKYQQRWGINRHYTVYFGKDTTLETLREALEIIMYYARQGNRFSLLFHRRQTSLCKKNGWNCLHTGIEVFKLSLLLPQRDFAKKIATIAANEPETLFVHDTESGAFPGIETAVPFSVLTGAQAPRSEVISKERP